MISRVILVAMLQPSGAILRDLLATAVEETGRMEPSNLARAIGRHALATWTWIRCRSQGAAEDGGAATPPRRDEPQAIPGACAHTTSVPPLCSCLSLSERRFSLCRLSTPSTPLDRQKNPG